MTQDTDPMTFADRATAEIQDTIQTFADRVIQVKTVPETTDDRNPDFWLRAWARGETLETSPLIYLMRAKEATERGIQLDGLCRKPWFICQRAQRHRPSEKDG